LILEKTLIPMLSDPSGTVPYFGLYITQPQLQYPIRIVNVRVAQDVVVEPNLANVYMQVPFTVVLSQEREGQQPRVELRAGIGENNLYEFMYQTQGGLNTKIELQVLLRSKLSDDGSQLICTQEASVVLYALEVVMRSDSVAMQLGYQLPLNMAAVRIAYRPDTAPGLF